MGENLVSDIKGEHRLRVFENRVLRRIVGPRRDEIVESLKESHNEELHNLHSSPNIIRMSKLRRMRLAGHAACMVEETNAYMVLVGQSQGKRSLGRSDVCGRKILKFISEKQDGVVWTKFVWLRRGTHAKPVMKPSSSIKC
jgi:proteasome assembly chaperone (PAC2) family protein